MSKLAFVVGVATLFVTVESQATPAPAVEVKPEVKPNGTNPETNGATATEVKPEDGANGANGANATNPEDGANGANGANATNPEDGAEGSVTDTSNVTDTGANMSVTPQPEWEDPCMTKGLKYEADLGESEFPADNFYACQGLCVQSGTCQFFSFQTPQNGNSTCTFSSTNKMVEESNQEFVSGPADCNANMTVTNATDNMTVPDDNMTVPDDNMTVPSDNMTVPDVTVPDANMTGDAATVPDGNVTEPITGGDTDVPDASEAEPEPDPVAIADNSSNANVDDKPNVTGDPDSSAGSSLPQVLLQLSTLLLAGLWVAA